MFPRVSVAEYTILWSPTGKKELGYGPSIWVMIATPELSEAIGTSQDMLTGWPLLSAYLKISSGQFCISGFCVSKWFYLSVSVFENLKSENKQKLFSYCFQIYSIIYM